MLDSATWTSMRRIATRFLYCLIFCLAAYTSYILLNPVSAFGADAESPVDTAPKIDHILLEVSNLDASMPSIVTSLAFASNPGARTL